MIDKINGNDSYEFHGGSTNKRKNPAVRAYENTPGSNTAQKQTAQMHKKRKEEEKETGVILDLSGKDAGKSKRNSATGQKQQSFWAGALRKIVAPVVRWLKDFWESDHTKQTDEEEEGGLPPLELSEPYAQQPVQESESLLEPEAIQEPESIQEQKKLADEVIKTGDLRQIEQFLTKNGEKRLAHNSDLLTYYDRRGKFVEMDETEKHRVLFGDKNVLKL